MSNTAVKWFRSASPQTTLTDDQITLKAYYLADQDARFAAFKEDPVFLERAQSLDKERRLNVAPSLFGEAVQAIKSGVDSTQARIYDTIGMIGSATGLDTVRDFGQRKAQENLDEAAINRPTLPDFSDVDNIGDAIRFTVGLAGSQAPQLAAVLAGSAAGAVAAPAVGLSLGAGAAIGALPVAFSQTQNYGDLIRQGIPEDEAVKIGFGTGVVSAALESLVPALAITPLFKAAGKAGAKRIADEMVKNLPEKAVVQVLRNAAKHSGIDGVAEAATEVAQESVTIASEIYAHRNNPDFEISDDDIRSRLLNAGVAGGILGGGIGGGVGAITADTSNNVPPAVTDETVPDSSSQPAQVQPVTPPKILAQERADLIFGQPPFEGNRPVSSLPEDPVNPAVVPDPIAPHVRQDLESAPVIATPALAGAPASSVDDQIDQAVTNFEQSLINQDLEGFSDASLDIREVFRVASQAGSEDTLRQKLASVLQANREAAIAIQDKINNQPKQVEDAPVVEALLEESEVVDVADEINEAPIDDAIVIAEATNNDVIEAVDENALEPEIVQGEVATADQSVEPESASEQQENPQREQAQFLVENFETDLSPVIETVKGKKFEAVVPFFTTISPDVSDDIIHNGARAGDAPKSQSRKVIFFEDTRPEMEGRAVGLPVFKNAKGEVVVTRPDFMTRLTKDGTKHKTQSAVPYRQIVDEGILSPEFAIRLTTGAALNGSVQESAIYFDDMSVFEGSVKAQADIILGRLRESASTVASSTLDLDDSAEGSIERGTVSGEALAAVQGKNFDVDAVEGGDYNLLANTLFEIAGTSQPTESQLRDALETAMEAVVPEPIVRKFMASILSSGQLAADKQFQQLERHEIFNEITRRAGPTITRIALSQAVQTGDGSLGSGSQGAITEGITEAEFFSIRDGQGFTGTTSELVRGKFLSTIESLTNAGITVSVDEAISQEFGQFSPSGNTIKLSLNDSQSPSLDNFRLLLHEAAHAVASSLPKDLYDAVQRAVGRYTRERLNLLSNSADPRIREDNPAGLDAQALAEEIFAETLAQEFGNTTISQTIAARVFRLLKDVYYRMAFLGQRMLGRQPNEILADRYARNRFEQLVGGDASSLIGFMVPGFDPRTDIDYADRFSVRKSQTEQTKAEMDIAALNEEAKIQNQIVIELSSSREIKEAASRSGTTAKQTILNILGMDDASDLAKSRASQIDPQTSAPLEADASTTLDSFKGQRIKGRVERDLLVSLQATIGKIAKLKASRELHVEQATKALEDHTKDLTERHEAWLDRSKFSKFFSQGMRAMLKRVTHDIEGTSHQMGEVTQELRDLRRDLSKKALLKNYGVALRKLTTTSKLPRNFNILKFFETLIADPEVNLLDDIATIKGNLKKSPNVYYDALTQDTAESDALLASLIAYARKDDVVILNLELSKMDAIADRHAIRERLAKLMKGAKGDFKDSLMELKTNFRLEAAARIAYRRAARKRDQYHAKIRKAKRVLEVVDPSLTRYREAESKLFGAVGAHAQFTRADGATYFVPERADSPSSEVRKRVHTLKLSGDNMPTKPAELESDLGKMFAWLESRLESGDIDNTFHDVATQAKQLSEGTIRKEGDKPGVLGYVWSTRWMSVPSNMARFGSNNADAVGQMIRGFQSNLHAVHRKTANHQKKIDRLFSQMIGVFRKNNSAMNLAAFKAQFYNPAVEFLSKQDDINDMDVTETEAWSIAMKRLKEHIDTVAGQKISTFRDQFHPVFSDLLHAVRDLNDMWEAELQGSGQDGVLDADITVTNPDGVNVPAMRSRIQRGMMTVPRSISKEALGLFRTMSHSDLAVPWQAFDSHSKLAIEAYKAGGASAAWDVIKGAFDNPTIQRFLVDPIFNNTSESNILPAPSQNYSSPLFDVVQNAYNGSGGNLIQALEQIAVEHDADPVVYIQDSLESIKDLYYQLRKGLEQTMPGEIATIKGIDLKDQESIGGNKFWSQMIPGIMINARKIDHWPSAWFTNSYFDDHTSAGISARVAAQKSFGINNTKLAKAFIGLSGEIAAKTDVFNVLEAEAAALGIDNKKDLDAFMAERIGSMDEYQKLRKLKALGDRVIHGEDSIPEGLWRFFHGKESPTEDLVLYKSLIGGLAGAMINQPASAMMQTSEIFAPVLNFGVSPTTMKGLARTSAATWRNFAGGLLNVFGINWKRTDEDIQRYRELGLNDPAVYDRITDVVLRPNRKIETFSDRVALLTQRFTQLREFSIKTKDADNVPFKPLAPFSQYAQVLNEAIIVNNWKTTKSFLGKSLEIFSHNDTSQADWSLDRWAKEMELGAADRDTFKKFIGVLESEYGLSYFQLNQEASKRMAEDKTPLSDRTSYLLAGMALSNVTQEGSIVNMPLGSFNNSALRLALPLLGWPYRQSLKVASKMVRNDGDRFTMQGFSRALLAMSVVAGGGLAISMAVDAYSEELLRKRRNLAPLSSAKGTARAQAVLEHLTRVGTFGLFGDLGLELALAGTGEGDLRGLSPERRVVALNSAFGLMRSMQSFLNQGFEADYNGVVRPVLFALGGNGILQATQVFNTLGGFDNSESRAVRRTNVNNWLRAAGRISGTELRKSGGGFSTKTPVTPFVTRMYLAALSNDPAGFRASYREAVSAAREAGKVEPESYINRTFSSRDPLQAFRTKPDSAELARILSVLPASGKQDVLGAIRMFQHYKSQLSTSRSSAKTSRKKRSRIFSGGLF